MARLISGLEVARIRENLERIRAQLPEGTEILAAVKYVPLEEIGTLAAAGITLAGENRAQDLEAKATAHPELRWHFIGQLQSRKVKQIVPYASSSTRWRRTPRCASSSATRRPETEILVEVNVARDEGKAGIAPEDLGAFIERAPVPVSGLMTMPPFAADPEQSRPHFAALKRLADEHGLRQLSMGTSQDYRVAAEEGATIVRLGSVLLA